MQQLGTPPTAVPVVSAVPPLVASPPKAAETDAEKLANIRDAIKQANQAIEKIQKRLGEESGPKTLIVCFAFAACFHASSTNAVR
ncbi:hypothetical protein BH11PLA2_BH11PLA2_27960 [soil metagenome]